MMIVTASVPVMVTALTPTALCFPAPWNCWGDAIDQDCDGGADTTPFGFGSLLWDAPRRPVVGKSGQHYLLSTTTDQLNTQSTSLGNVGVTLLFDKNSPGFDEPYVNQPFIWQTANSSHTLGRGLDILSDTASGLVYPATSYYRPSNGNTYLINRQLKWNVLTDTYDQALAFDSMIESDTYLDIDLALPSPGEVWTFACGSQTLHLITASATTGVWRSEDTAELQNNAAGSVCFLDASTPSAVVGTVCNGVSCTSYDLDPDATAGQEIKISASQDWSAENFSYADTRDGWLIATYPTTGVKIHKLDNGTHHDLLSGHKVYAADMMMHGAEFYLAAIIDDGNSGREVVLSYGDPASNMNTATFDFVETGVRNLTPEGISLHVDSKRVFMAVSGPEEGKTANKAAVGWLFLGIVP